MKANHNMMPCIIALFSCQDYEENPPLENEVASENTDYELSTTQVEALLNNFIKTIKPTINTKVANQFKIVDSRKRYSESVATRSGESTRSLSMFLI